MARALLSNCRVTRGATRGFTLIEMMIVVVIVGILASLAVVGYRRLITASHVSEATNNVQAIRVAQEGYHADTMTYANISLSLTSWYPNPIPVGNKATMWGAQCASQCTAGYDWSMLPLHIDGTVLFGYATVAGGAGTNPAVAQITVDGQVMTFPSPSPTDWFIVAASCDLDNQGVPNTSVYTTSWSNQVFVDAEGQ